MHSRAFSIQHSAKLNLYCRIAEHPTSPNAIICFIHTAAGTSASIELANRSLLSNWKAEAPFRAMTHIMWKSQSYILNETQDNGGWGGAEKLCACCSCCVCASSHIRSHIQYVSVALCYARRPKLLGEHLCFQAFFFFFLGDLLDIMKDLQLISNVYLQIRPRYTVLV